MVSPLRVWILALCGISAFGASQGQRGTTGERGGAGRGQPLTTSPIVVPKPVGVPAPVPLAPIGPAATPQPDLEDRPGSISGIVLRGGTQEGLGGARVKLVAVAHAGLDALAELDEADDGTDSELAVHADAGGRFIFMTVPPGRYTLIAQRDGFVRQTFGQRGANAFGAAISIADGQTLQDVTLQMRPAPTISGTISSTAREPLAAAIVQAFRLHYTPFGRELRLTQTAMTNDRGEYRLFWLSPGDYYVAASYNRSSALQLPAEIPENPNLSKPDDVYSGVYFPGQTNWADAEAVRVEAADVSGVNIQWSDANRAAVRGQIDGGAEAAAKAKITLLLPDGNPVPGFSQPVRSDAAGGFNLRVTPGDYVLLAENAVGNMFSEVTPLHVPERGIEDLKVALKLGLLMGAVATGGEKIEGVLLKLCRLGPPSLGQKACYGNYSYSPHGQIHFKPFFLPYDDFDVFLSLPSGFTLMKAPLEGAPGEAGPVLSQTSVPIASLLGRSNDHLQVSALPRTMIGIPTGRLTQKALMSVSLGPVPEFAGGDCERWVTGELAPPPNACLIFAIGRSGFMVSGNVRNATGENISGAQVVLVPEPVRSGGIRPPNRYFAATTDALGRFEIPGVAAGAYTALAFEELEAGAYYAPDFLQNYARRGIPVSAGPPQSGTGRGGARPDGSLNLVLIPREEANR